MVMTVKMPSVLEIAHLSGLALLAFVVQQQGSYITRQNERLMRSEELYRDAQKRLHGFEGRVLDMEDVVSTLERELADLKTEGKEDKRRGRKEQRQRRDNHIINSTNNNNNNGMRHLTSVDSDWVQVYVKGGGTTLHVEGSVSVGGTLYANTIIPLPTPAPTMTPAPTSSPTPSPTGSLVAFQAQATSTQGNLGANVLIAFTSASLNIESAYDASSSTFTARGLRSGGRISTPSASRTRVRTPTCTRARSTLPP